MSLRPLINGQKIIIDDHRRGNREVKDWDDPFVDIHIDKRTKRRVGGKGQEVIIKVPVNSNREIEIKSAKEHVPVPRILQKEIEGAFKNRSIREQFIYDVVKTLKDFNSYSSTKERAIDALKRISKHFDLAWNDDEVNTFYTNTMYSRYEKEVLEDGKLYRISIDGEKLEVEEV